MGRLRDGHSRGVAHSSSTRAVTPQRGPCLCSAHLARTEESRNVAYDDCVPLGGVRQSLPEALKSWTYTLTVAGVYELRLYTPTGVSGKGCTTTSLQPQARCQPCTGLATACQAVAVPLAPCRAWASAGRFKINSSLSYNTTRDCDKLQVRMRLAHACTYALF